MKKIKESQLVVKRNVLNELRSNNMTLQELRFFSIYLSQINPQNVETRIVRFKLDDFKSIMELGRINIDYMKETTNQLLSKIVNIPNERGGYEGFQLFKECGVDQENNGEWYIEIDAHDKALPLMFEFKNKYFSYRLWNALSLKSTNQLRMYEILKQYEKIGYRILSINELRNLLGIRKEEYPRFNNFRQWVIEPCRQAMEEYTDIKFSYEPYGAKGSGGKVLALKFKIEKNENYRDRLSLEQFIEMNKEEETIVQPENTESIYDERISFLSEACDDEFSKSEIRVLYDIMLATLPYYLIEDSVKCFDYLHRKYNELNMMSEKSKIKHRFNYLKSIMDK